MNVQIPTIPAALWERLKNRIRSQRPLGSRSVRVIESPEGVSLVVEPPVRRTHPWQLSAEWVPERVADSETGERRLAGHWEISVRPGFLNGRDVLSRVVQGARISLLVGACGKTSDYFVAKEEPWRDEEEALRLRGRRRGGRGGGW